MFEDFWPHQFQVTADGKVKIFFSEGWRFEVVTSGPRGDVSSIIISCYEEIQFEMDERGYGGALSISAVAELYGKANQYATIMYDPSRNDRQFMINAVREAGMWLRDLG